MKIIVTGKNSYIGTNVKKFFESKGHLCKTVSLRNGLDGIDFTGYDAVVHCVAAVHKKEKAHKDLYKKINTILAVDTAKKAKCAGVKHFIFLSSMSVYGDKISKISKDTKPNPVSLYGKSKLDAEKKIFNLADENFIVTVLRPPMVYGKNCPGNYVKLRKIVKTFPLFPKSGNKKSIIYVKNLAVFIYSLAIGKDDEKKSGIFLPMDSDYVSTDFIAETIAKSLNKKLIISKFMGTVIKIFKNVKILKKAFGDLYYDESCATKINFIKFTDAVFEIENKY